jgi:hypothetical protein
MLIEQKLNKRDISRGRTDVRIARSRVIPPCH